MYAGVHLTKHNYCHFEKNMTKRMDISPNLVFCLENSPRLLKASFFERRSQSFAGLHLYKNGREACLSDLTEYTNQIFQKRHRCLFNI